MADFTEVYEQVYPIEKQDNLRLIEEIPLTFLILKSTFQYVLKDIMIHVPIVIFG